MQLDLFIIFQLSPPTQDQLAVHAGGETDQKIMTPLWGGSGCLVAGLWFISILTHYLKTSPTAAVVHIMAPPGVTNHPI